MKKAKKKAEKAISLRVKATQKQILQLTESLDETNFQLFANQVDADHHKNQAKELKKKLDQLELDVWWNKTDAML